MQGIGIGNIYLRETSILMTPNISLMNLYSRYISLLEIHRFCLIKLTAAQTLVHTLLRSEMDRTSNAKDFLKLIWLFCDI